MIKLTSILSEIRVNAPLQPLKINLYYSHNIVREAASALDIKYKDKTFTEIGLDLPIIYYPDKGSGRLEWVSEEEDLIHTLKSLPAEEYGLTIKEIDGYRSVYWDIMITNITTNPNIQFRVISD
jgi:hypothetical protein